MKSRHKQVTGRRQRQMAHHRSVGSHFEMIHAQFGFVVLETAFDVPAAEGHMQDRGQRGLLRRVANEVFDLLVIQAIARHDQPVRPGGQVVLVFQVNRRGFDLPDNGTLGAILGSRSRG